MKKKKKRNTECNILLRRWNENWFERHAIGKLTPLKLTAQLSADRERQAGRCFYFTCKNRSFSQNGRSSFLKKFQIIMVNYGEWYNYRGCELPESYFLGQLLCLWHVVFIEVLPNVFFLLIINQSHHTIYVNVKLSSWI